MKFPRHKRTRWREHQCARIADGILRVPEHARWMAALSSAIYMLRAYGDRISADWDLV